MEAIVAKMHIQATATHSPRPPETTTTPQVDRTSVLQELVEAMRTLGLRRIENDQDSNRGLPDLLATLGNRGHFEPSVLDGQDFRGGKSLAEDNR